MLVPTGLQQADVLRKHTRLRVAEYTGDVNVTSWKEEEWNQELQEQDVWVMTPQILLDALRLAFVKVLSNCITTTACTRAAVPHICLVCGVLCWA